MKEKILFTALLLSTAAAPGVLAGEIDPALERILRNTPADQPVSALVYVADRVNLDGITRHMDAINATLSRRHFTVVTAMQEKAAITQPAVLADLDAGAAAGRVFDVEPFWLGNIIRVDAIPAEIRRIAARPDIEMVYFNHPIELIAPVMEAVEVDHGLENPQNIEPGVIAVRAPEVWNDLGFTGAGVLVSSLDTGVDGNHPALASRWRGLDPRYTGNPEWAWFDPVTNTTFPRGWGSHGTHTMGSVCGGPPGNQIGVAPDAEWIHAATIDRVSIPRTVSDSILAFQWVLAPTGNPQDHWAVPDACSNSWGLVTGHGYPNCDQTFWSYLDACEAAGIVIIFSAGNEGSSGLRRPADRATDEYRTFAIGAIDANNPNWPIASFSSRGPTFCTPNQQPAIKPDMVAPGVAVRSALVGGGYGNMSGTSMASPHINGVVALMREANPNISVEAIKQIIYDTAVDLGQQGKDNTFGWGMVDAFEAVSAAMSGEIPIRLTTTNIVAGVRCQADVFRATPFERVFFAASLVGRGETYVEPLNVTLDILAPQLLGSRIADADGQASLIQRVPEWLEGRTIWFQAAQVERKSNVVERVVQ